jgi:hypothetical protein
MHTWNRVKTTTLRLACASLCLSCYTGVWAADWTHEFPDPQQVISAVDGDDELENLARQKAALGLLYDVLREVAGSPSSPGGSQSTPSESAAIKRYGTALSAWQENLPAEYKGGCEADWFARQLPALFCERYRLHTRSGELAYSFEFQREILGSLSRSTIDEYYRLRQATSDAYTNSRGLPRKHVNAFAPAPAAEEPERAVPQIAFAQLLKPGALGSFYLWWLLPSIALLIYASMDRDETKTVHGTAYSATGYADVELEVPTGRTIKGDVRRGVRLGIGWTFFCPLAYAWFTTVDESTGVFVGLILGLLGAIAVAALITWALLRPNVVSRIVLWTWLAFLGLNAVYAVMWLVE